jgi:hypothetical protein
VTIDPLHALKSLASRWRSSARTLSDSADVAASEFRTGEALDDAEPMCIKSIRDMSATLAACALEVETIVMRFEKVDAMAEVWTR